MAYPVSRLMGWVGRGPSGAGLSWTGWAWFARGSPQEHDAPVEIPETRYAKTADGVHLAYQVAGDGPIDFVVVGSAFIASVDLSWEFPVTAAISRRPRAGPRQGQFAGERLGSTKPCRRARRQGLPTPRRAADVAPGLWGDTRPLSPATFS